MPAETVVNTDNYIRDLRRREDLRRLVNVENEVLDRRH